MKFPLMFTVIPMDGYFILVTGTNIAKLEGTFKFFQSLDEVRNYIHGASLSALPEWHRANCIICRA